MPKRKRSDENPNQDICDILLEIGEYEKNIGENMHKYNAYLKAAIAISRHPTRLTSGSEAKKLKGVGEKISQKIDEYLTTGTLKKLEEVRSSADNELIAQLTRVSGIGPHAARKYISWGMKTIADLRENQDKLPNHTQIGLKYFKDLELKIPREEIAEIEKLIKIIIKQVDAKYIVTICGSYRRGRPTSGDIDVLLTHTSYTSKSLNAGNHLKKIIKALKDKGLLMESISLGKVKYMGICNVDCTTKNPMHPFRRIDIRIFPSDQYYCAILYFTGSDTFNKEMRTHALQEGFTLNEYCIRRLGSTGVPGEPLRVNSEEDVFEYIDYPFKKPSQRN